MYVHMSYYVAVICILNLGTVFNLLPSEAVGKGDCYPAWPFLTTGSKPRDMFK